MFFYIIGDISTPWSPCMSSECFQNSSASWLKFLSQDTCSVKIEMQRKSCSCNVVRWASTGKAKSLVEKPEKMRVIGIMAHIDAGKTTTTERMLYFSGFQSTFGEVHHGDTTMDYLEQERERGITIQSAAVSFPWADHSISLVDTPGHVDFTIEVERALRVVDGAVAILDASAGVEAQTITVWQQADRYSVPRICYLNKMDKPAACHQECLGDLRGRLKANPLLLQLPIGEGRKFCGVVDLITGTEIRWNADEKSAGRKFSVLPLDSTSPHFPPYLSARASLCEQLGDLDGAVAEHILEHEDPARVPQEVVRRAVRCATIAQQCVPVLLGSSFRNVGVQPLLDAVTKYLPNPVERLPANVGLYSPHLCALAFKVHFDPQRGGLLTYVRVYSGTLEQGSKFYNVSRGCYEKCVRLYKILADEFQETAAVGAGAIVAVSGLKKTITGDTLVSSQAMVDRARKKVAREAGGAKDEEHLLVGVKVPEPVFYCSIEASAPRFQKSLEQALAVLQREDPSLRVEHDTDTGQMVLKGMGELHIEVLASRLKSQYKVEAELGRLQVAYFERLGVEHAEKHLVVDKTIGEVKQHVELCLLLESVADDHTFHKASFSYTKENIENLQSIRQPHLNAINSGIGAAFSGGPLLFCPVKGVRASIKWFSATKRTSDAFISATASQCVKQILCEAGCVLSEPLMLLAITGEEEFSQNILADLNKRRAEVMEVSVKSGVKFIRALVPLAELIGYSSVVRRLSSGRASFSMELARYRSMGPNEQREAIKAVTGFYPSS